MEIEISNMLWCYCSIYSAYVFKGIGMLKLQMYFQRNGLVIDCIDFSGRAGVPMEVMGLMLGEFVDDYTVRVIDVFAMPQSGTVILF